MAISNAPLNLSMSTRVLLLLLLTIIGCYRPSSSAVIRVQVNDMWRNPCEGGSAVVDDDTEELPETVTLTTGEARDAFAQLSLRSTRLEQIINSLKNDYVLARFGDAQRADQWKEAGFTITGSPTWTVANDSISETLLVCYESLARLSVLTRLVREGERSAETRERHHFASRFQEIENSHEAGLNLLMCSLHAVMTSWGVETMSPETEAEVASIRFETVPNHAIRHGRDYIVLLVLENSVDRLSSSFDRLVGQVVSQTTTTTSATLTTTQ